MAVGHRYLGEMNGNTRSFGEHLKSWRKTRRKSQLDLACDAEISSRHLSFLETGRSEPSREMVLHLGHHLGVPSRAQNAMLLAAGFAPVFPDRPLDDPAMDLAREAVERVVHGHSPYPALAVDRHWNLVTANYTVGRMIEGLDPVLMEPPVNVLRISMHPDGLAPRILNMAQWGAHLLARLQQQIDASGDPFLIALKEELAGYYRIHAKTEVLPPDYQSVVLPFEMESPVGPLSLFTTTTVFGTPVDITLSELAIESFFPANPQTAERLRMIAGS